jgi:hypothetical protein
MFLANNFPTKNFPPIKKKPGEEFSVEEFSDESCSDEECSDKESSSKEFLEGRAFAAGRMVIQKSSNVDPIPHLRYFRFCRILKKQLLCCKSTIAA